MDSSRLTTTPNRSLSSSIYYRTNGLSPKRSPTTESVQKRRKEIKRAEKAAYRALFNISIASLLYYDLCYTRLASISCLLTYAEWFICSVFIMGSCYDLITHFWPHTFMKPISVNPTEKRLLGIEDQEFGFEVIEPKPMEIVYEKLPFEIHNSFEADGNYTAAIARMSISGASRRLSSNRPDRENSRFDSFDSSASMLKE